MRKGLCKAFLGVAIWASLIGPSRAQVDPRTILAQMISALQICGPPAAYQMLMPQLFQIIYQQTGGSGCYADIRAAGPIVNMQVLAQQMFPVGPLYIIRVQHQSGVTVDWFIGFNQFQNYRIQLLMFQTAAGAAPTINTGPLNIARGGSDTVDPPPPVNSQTQTPQPASCSLYAGMC